MAKKNSVFSADLPPKHSQGSSAKLHVVPNKGQWDVRVGNNSGKTYATKVQAVRAARTIAKSKDADIIVHGATGRVKHRISTSRADEIMLGVWQKTSSGGSASHRKK